MARIYKGSSYTLQLLIAKSTSSPIENVKFDFFTIDPKVTVLVEDGITIDGNLAKVKIGDTQFDALADGLISYVVYGTRDGMSYMEERQSNYYLKTPEGEKPVIPDVDMNNYYTKEEVDEMLTDIEVEVDLDDYYTKTDTDNAINLAITTNNTKMEELGYATQDWVNEQHYATESYVEDAIANLPSGGGDTSNLETQIQDNKAYILSLEARLNTVENDHVVYIMNAFRGYDGKLESFELDKGGDPKRLSNAIMNGKRIKLEIRIQDAGMTYWPITFCYDNIQNIATIKLLFETDIYDINIDPEGRIYSFHGSIMM